MNIDSTLAQLSAAELVRRTTDVDQAYIFKHGLTQDSAYQSLLQKQRREIHREVAQAYEALYGDRCLDEYAPILAQHYAQAGDQLKAFNYAARAGEDAAHKFANAEASAYYLQAIQIARRMKTPPGSQPSLQDLYLKIGRVYELSDQFDQALDMYGEMESVARERGDRAMELASLIARATIYSIPNPHFDREHSKILCAQALELARAIGDEASEAKILWNLLLAHSRLDMHYRDAVVYGEQGIAIARKLNLREQLAYLLNDISLLYALNGNPELGVRYNLESRPMWREQNNLPMLADNLGYAVMYHVLLGEYVQAIDESREALKTIHRIGNGWSEAVIDSWLSDAYRELGEIDQAIVTMQNAVRLAEHSIQAPLAYTRADLGWLYGDLGQLARGLELAQHGYREGERIAPILGIYTSAALAHLHVLTGDLVSAHATIDQAFRSMQSEERSTLFDSALNVAQVELSLAQKDYARAIEICERSITSLRTSRLRQHSPDLLYLKGLALMRRGIMDEAFACLRDAQDEAERSGSRWMLWRILAALAEVEEQRDNRGEAKALRAQARAHLDFIIAHTPGEFRESFLNTPSVMKLLG